MSQQSIVNSQQTAISVAGVYKDFKLPHEKVGSVKNIFTNFAHAISASRTYTRQHALKDISLEIKQGEFFGIVGRNGSGKSTLLKILAGIYQPTKGKVQVRGKLVPFIELGVGFNPELSGRDNIYLNGALLGFDRKEIDEMYDDVVAFAELEEFMDQKLKNYSSGMQVRLAFSMAVRAKADILLIDEVLAVGDADFQRKCFNYFNKLRKEKITVVFVSHNMDAIREYCDRAILIEKSLVIASGTADKIATQYTKLFTPEMSVEKTKGVTKRWGDKKMVQLDVVVDPCVPEKNDKEIILKVQYEAKGNISKPVFGFRIKKRTGEPLMGSNSHIVRLETGDFKVGETGVFIWTIPNVFEDGKYTIDTAISHSDGVTQCDWWEDAVGFTSFRDNHTPYSISPLVDAKLER